MDKTQVWLAKKLGVTRQTAGEWVRGDEKVPQYRRAQIVLFLQLVPHYPLFDANGYALTEET